MLSVERLPDLWPPASVVRLPASATTNGRTPSDRLFPEIFLLLIFLPHPPRHTGAFQGRDRQENYGQENFPGSSPSATGVVW